MTTFRKIGTVLCCVATAIASPGLAGDKTPVPADRFDLSEWNITLPMDEDGNGKADQVTVKALRKYAHPDFFYLDNDGQMVFTAPNKAVTTPNSSNTRSELRHMLRGTNTRIKTHSAKNNFAVEARKDSDKFGRVGGRMDATLSVDHVPQRAADPKARAAYSVVVGQIHAAKYDDTKSGFGYGNEPLKIFYKKFPDHDYGSVFWTYERNLAKSDPNRTDIAYPVFGALWSDTAEPGLAGIALGEPFSYTVNVHKNTMYLHFSTERHADVSYAINLADQRDANGQIDPLDNRYSYGGDTLYFKAGAYNQCSTRNDKSGQWVGGCEGTGDWSVDEAKGNFVRARFSKLEVGPSTAP